ncbi:MAG TPA: outer membrane beta-barrel protein [Candidatus Binatia bacterium]|nr:outer membrane beta-barrel protein [Candidatus Binatia bacterium]
MRRILLYLLLAAAVLAVAAPAQAQHRRYRDYDRPRSSSVEGQTIATIHLGLSSPTGDFDTFFNSGLGFGGSIAYGVSRSVLLSFELSHHDFGGELPRDDASVTPMTFNAAYVFPTGGSVVPWAGGGIGAYGHHERIEDGISPGVDFDDSETAFGYNLGAGIGGPIARRTLLGGGFRFHHVDGDRLLEANFWTFQVGLGFML